MAVWLMAALAWLTGVAWQTSEPSLWPLAIYQSGVALALGMAGACWCLWRVPGMAMRDRWWLTGLRCGLGLFACMVLAWSMTGWRAGKLMREHVPTSWLTQYVSVDVQVEGLPQPVPGGVMLDARVLHWSPTQVQALHESDACCLPMHLHLRLNDSSVAMPWAGQQWRMAVKLHPPDGLSNPGGFDATLSLFERGVRAVGRVKDKGAVPKLLDDQAERPWQGVVDRWRQRIRTLIFDHVKDKRAAGVLAGLAVGDQSAIEHEDWDVFRRTGVAHLVSISGTHIAMLGWIAAGLTRRLWARWHAGVHVWPASDVAMWAAVWGSGLYALLAGWGVPAQRTVWMMLIMVVLRTGGRRWPWPLTWLISAVFITMADPWAMRQVGFWLSYVAVGVLMSSGLNGQASQAHARSDNSANAVASLPWWQAWAHKMGRSFTEMLKTQAMVTLALTPLSLVCFQQTSLVSLLANLFAIPVFSTVITPLALLGTVWSPCWDAGAWVLGITMQALSVLSAWPLATTSAVSLPMWAAALAVLAGFVQALSVPWRWRVMTLPCLMPLVYLPQGQRLLGAPAPFGFQVLAADVGQGTAVLVRTARHTLLFDAGPRIGEQINAGDRTLLPLMRTLGIGHIDTLMISHQDSDHVGGAAAIVRELPVAHLLTSLADDHPLRHQPGASGQIVPHQACLLGQHWQWEGVDFAVLHPTPDEYAHREHEDHNALSCVLRVSTPVSSSGPGRSVLITADIEAEQEAAILERSRDELKSDVLIVPHHGSKTSSTKAFLAAVSPVQSVIQVGRRNVYKHPSKPVLARYDEMGLAWQATPDCGAYVWDSQERPRVDQHGDQAHARADEPRLGHCWRHAHHRYWDAQAQIKPDADSP